VRRACLFEEFIVILGGVSIWHARLSRALPKISNKTKGAVDVRVAPLASIQ
jgi:hypothetical protein